MSVTPTCWKELCCFKNAWISRTWKQGWGGYSEVYPYPVITEVSLSPNSQEWHIQDCHQAFTDHRLPCGLINVFYKWTTNSTDMDQFTQLKGALTSRENGNPSINQNSPALRLKGSYACRKAYLLEAIGRFGKQRTASTISGIEVWGRMAAFRWWILAGTHEHLIHLPQGQRPHCNCGFPGLWELPMLWR